MLDKLQLSDVVTESRFLSYAACLVGSCAHTDIIALYLLFIYLFLSTFSDDVEGKSLHFHMHDALDMRPGNIKGHCQMLFLLAAKKSDIGFIVSESELKSNT